MHNRWGHRKCCRNRAKEKRSMRPEITEGATLADYELPDHTDTPRTLSVAARR